MDLTKLLANRMGARRPRGGIPSATPAQQFLAQTAVIVDQDLKLITRCAPPDETISYIGLRLLSGSFAADGNRIQHESSKTEMIDYLFLQVPSQPGFLLRAERDGSLILERATRAVPQVTDFSGEVVQRHLFVSNGKNLEHFAVLDENTVRSSNGKTLSLGMFSEMLVSLAFDELESSLGEWIHN
jgi:hypothetical protein